MKVSDKIYEFANKLAREGGYILVNIAANGIRSVSIDIALDKEGGITLDECADFNKNLSAWIESENIFSSGYTLDVSSPGLDRVLKSETEFEWALGKRVEVKTYEPVNEKKTIIGKLLRKNESEGIVIEEHSGDNMFINERNAAKVRIKVDV